MWVIKEPNYGDQIKVNRGYYSHHGIYATKNSVYHFAPPGRTDRLDPCAARIIETTLEEFLKGGQLEVRVYTEEEKRKRGEKASGGYRQSSGAPQDQGKA